MAAPPLSFVIYRNMLLDEAQRVSSAQGLPFDVVMNVDLDIFSIDVRTFMNELFYSGGAGVDGLCVDGVDWMGYTRDTFATVSADGEWLHYGRGGGAVSEYSYNNEHAMLQRTLMPNQERRFEAVKSCFGGVMALRNRHDAVFRSGCRYTLTRDIFFTEYNNSVPAGFEDDSALNTFRYDEEWWTSNRHHNEYSERSKAELAAFRNEYIELLQFEDKRILDRSAYPKDGDICEHIPFQYCLHDAGFNLAISSRAKLYYDEYFPVRRRRNDTNWAYYSEHRPEFTK